MLWSLTSLVGVVMTGQLSGKRTGRRELEIIRTSLSDGDLAILRLVADHRFLTTNQICKFHFTNKPTKTAALRSANRTLARLRDLRLLVSLERRIGGVRAGSGSFVWSLGIIGARTLNDGDANGSTSCRYREHEPTTTFLEHHLAVAEVHLELQMVASGQAIALSSLQLEPTCWRSYLGPGGERRWLKPDLAVTTTSDDFEDHWFFEIDRGTEPPSRVLRKCLQYREYRATGIEAHRVGVFPAVVWIVPSSKRVQSLQICLKEREGMGDRLFSFITLDQLGDLVISGPEGGTQ